MSPEKEKELTMSMTRADAINEIQGAYLQLAGEFCCTASEEDAAKRECRDALIALGVTEAELGGN